MPVGRGTLHVFRPTQLGGTTANSPAPARSFSNYVSTRRGGRPLATCVRLVRSTPQYPDQLSRQQFVMLCCRRLRCFGLILEVGPCQFGRTYSLLPQVGPLDSSIAQKIRCHYHSTSLHTILCSWLIYLLAFRTWLYSLETARQPSLSYSSSGEPSEQFRGADSTTKDPGCFLPRDEQGRALAFGAHLPG